MAYSSSKIPFSVKIGAKVVSHGRYVTFEIAEVAIPGDVFENCSNGSPPYARRRRRR